jgi:hypothetical protein
MENRENSPLQTVKSLVSLFGKEPPEPRDSLHAGGRIAVDRDPSIDFLPFL